MELRIELPNHMIVYIIVYTYYIIHHIHFQNNISIKLCIEQKNLSTRVHWPTICDTYIQIYDIRNYTYIKSIYIYIYTYIHRFQGSIKSKNYIRYIRINYVSNEVCDQLPPPVQSRPMAAACATASPGPPGPRGPRGLCGCCDKPRGGESCTKLGPWICEV